MNESLSESTYLLFALSLHPSTSGTSFRCKPWHSLLFLWQPLTQRPLVVKLMLPLKLFTIAKLQLIIAIKQLLAKRTIAAASYCCSSVTTIVAAYYSPVTVIEVTVAIAEWFDGPSSLLCFTFEL